MRGEAAAGTEAVARRRRHGGGWHGGWRGGWGWAAGAGAGVLTGGDITTLITPGITTLITGITPVTVILTHIGYYPY